MVGFVYLAEGTTFIYLLTKLMFRHCLAGKAEAPFQSPRAIGLAVSNVFGVKALLRPTHNAVCAHNLHFYGA